MHYLQSWAVNDFDLFEFIGQDEQESQLSGGASQNGDPYNQQQFEDTGKEGQEDYMYSVMQYNDMAVGHDNNQQMYGLNDMSNGFLQDNRYQNSSSSSILDSTINKLHQQQQLQNQNQQPSTSRLSNVVASQQQQPQQSYAGRMRPQLASQLGQQQQINADLAENVLLPTSSTSPQNSSMYMPQQTLVKTEPTNNYDMSGEYFDSTSDNESHYSHNGTRLINTPSNKPRKYRIKPEAERVNPQYRMKRAKNNDAVRRSREKAKQQQVEKEKRLSFLETEHNDHYKLVNSYKQRIRELEAENMALRKNCNCGGAQQMFRR